MNVVYKESRIIKIEVSFTTRIEFVPPKIVLANKPDNKKRIADITKAHMATIMQAEKKSSLNFSVLFSAAKKRISEELKPSMAKGLSKETVIFISDQVP